MDGTLLLSNEIRSLNENSNTMKKIFCIHLIALLMCTTATSAQTYTVPWAQQQPAWVFPLWFEDGSGARDTLYFCYESHAIYGLPLDTLFGEKKIPIDTSVFNSFFACSFSFVDLLCFKTFVTDTESLGQPVCVWHAFLPLKITWDSNLFYSDSLPYPEQDPAPRAKGGFYFDIPMVCLDPGIDCFGTILMTDTIVNASCYATDSIVLGGNGFSTFWFGISPWDGLEWPSGIEAAETQIEWQVYPTLINTSVQVKNNGPSRSVYRVYDVWGRVVREGTISAFDQIIVDTQDWRRGLLILIISNQHRESSFRLLKP
jgi:hypothetical protein